MHSDIWSDVWSVRAPSRVECQPRGFRALSLLASPLRRRAPRTRRSGSPTGRDPRAGHRAIPRPAPSTAIGLAAARGRGPGAGSVQREIATCQRRLPQLRDLEAELATLQAAYEGEHARGCGRGRGGGACIGGGGNAQPGHCEHVIVEARLRFCVFLQPRCLPLNTVSGSHDDEEQLTTHSHSWCSHPTRPYHSRCIGYLHFFSCPVNIFTKKWEPSYSPQPWGRPGGAVGGRLGGPPQRGPLAAARARPQGQSRCAGMGKGGGSGLLGNQWKL